MATARLGLTALDCSDPSVLADFWAALLGGEVTHRNGEFHAVKVDGGLLVAVKVHDYEPPTWPDPTVPKQMHLHLKVDDLDAAQTDAVRLGARVAAEQTNPEHWRILLDPAGHPFCLATQILDWHGRSSPKPGSSGISNDCPRNAASVASKPCWPLQMRAASSARLSN